MPTRGAWRLPVRASDRHPRGMRPPTAVGHRSRPPPSASRTEPSLRPADIRVPCAAVCVEVFATGRTDLTRRECSVRQPHSPLTARQHKLRQVRLPGAHICAGTARLADGPHPCCARVDILVGGNPCWLACHFYVVRRTPHALRSHAVPRPGTDVEALVVGKPRLELLRLLRRTQARAEHRGAFALKGLSGLSRRSRALPCTSFAVPCTSVSHG
jgi:hypothetical protein